MLNLMGIKTWILRILCLAIILYSLEGLLYAENNEEKYNPYPIVFVHGYNVLPEKASKSDLWKKTSKELQKYFFVDPDDPYNSEYKYHNTRLYNYEAVFDYRAMSEGDIEDISAKLADYIDEVLNRLPAYQKKKVIIVAHSMGGLVTRCMLSRNDKNGKSYQEKVAKVVFVDSPLLGSPLASGVILIDRLRPDLKQKKQDYSKYADPDISLHTSPVALAYCDLYNQISDHLKFCDSFVEFDILISVQDMLAGYRNPYALPNSPNPGRYIPTIPHYEGQKVAVGELVVPATTEASKVFVGNAKIRDNMFGGIVICSTEPVQVESHYGKSETFLNNQASVLAIPNNFRTIQGSGEKSWFRGKAGSAVFKLFADYSGLPEGNKLEDLDIGDGVVTPFSQTALARNQSGLNSKIYHIVAFHTEAPDRWKTILEAVDDEPPAVESIRVVSADRTKNGADYSVYVIAKVKEYLLADIRFSYLTIDEQQVDLGEFYEMGNDYELFPFKPYVKFERNFLQKRQDPNITNNAGTPQTLYPGEFYVKLDTEGNEPHTVKLKMKNPAGKESEEKTVKFQRPIINNESPTGTVYDSKPTIEARIHSPLCVDIDTDPNYREVRIDGTKVSSGVTGSNFDITISCVPEHGLANGEHTVTINGKDVNGLPAMQKQWTFNINSQDPIITDERPKGYIPLDQVRPTIGARIYSPIGTQIRISSLVLRVDDDVVPHTTSGSGSSITVSYIPPSDLTHGSHTVSLTGSDTNYRGASKTWTFTIQDMLDWEETWTGGTGGMHRYYKIIKGYPDHDPPSERIDDVYGPLQGDHTWSISLNPQVIAKDWYGTYVWETWGILDGSCIGSPGGVTVDITNRAFTEVRRGDLPYVFYRGWQEVSIDSKGWIWSSLEPSNLTITEDSELIWNGTGAIQIKFNYGIYGSEGYGPYPPGTYSLADLSRINLRTVWVEFLCDDSDKAVAHLDLYEVGTDTDQNSGTAHCGGIRITNLHIGNQ